MNADLQNAFRALADPSRRIILRELGARELSVAEVAQKFAITRAAVKKHLTVLEEGGLISARSAGRVRFNRLEPGGLRAVADWLGYFDRFWDERLERLQSAIEAEEGKRMSNTTITKTVFFAAAPETVWGFLTERDKLGRWFFAAEADLDGGADYTLVTTGEDGARTRQCWGRVLEMDRPRLLRYTFNIAPLQGVETVVTWRLDAVDGGTRLTLTHEGIAAAGDAALGLLTALDSGWDRHLGQLRATVAA